MADLVPFDAREGEIWLDGSFVTWQDAKIHVLTHGLHYASSVFEGVRAYDGKIFKLHEHTERLFKSAEIIGFQIPYTVEEINKATIETVERNGFGDKDCYVRPVAWRGSEMMGVSAQNNKIHVAIAAWPWGSYYSDLRLTMASYKRPSPETAPVHSKAAGLYMICTICKHEAENKGFGDALMLDYRGYIAEATSANIFLVIDGALHTPIPDCCLNGITRQTAMELARKRGIDVVERHIPLEDLDKAQEVFVTGSAAEITAVKAIDERQFQHGQITKTLQEDYKELTRAD